MRRPDDATLDLDGASIDEASIDEANIDDANVERLARERSLAAGYREAARRALAFARCYREEEGTAGGAREQACIAQAQEWRRVVRDLHAGLPVRSVPDGIGPGVARTRPVRLESDGRKTG